jgi:hypothetical protein
VVVPVPPTAPPPTAAPTNPPPPTTPPPPAPPSITATIGGETTVTRTSRWSADDKDTPRLSWSVSGAPAGSRVEVRGATTNGTQVPIVAILSTLPTTDPAAGRALCPGSLIRTMCFPRDGDWAYEVEVFAADGASLGSATAHLVVRQPIG